MYPYRHDAPDGGRKRWWVAGLLWLIAAYPLASGPWLYSGIRGWRVSRWATPVFKPLLEAEDRLLPEHAAVGRPVLAYNRFWMRLADWHEVKSARRAYIRELEGLWADEQDPALKAIRREILERERACPRQFFPPEWFTKGPSCISLRLAF